MPKVLIVEDDANIRALLERRLGQLGHRVMAACSAEDALAVVSERGAPDVFVLDVLMPGVSGLELLTRLRQDPTYADVPAIFLSGRVKDSDIAAGQALGATYLTKPVVMSALAAAITKALQAPAATGGW